MLKKLKSVVDSWLFNGLSTVIILSNCVVLALYEPLSPSSLDFNESAEFWYLLVYTIEAALILIAYQKEYFYSGWNILDILIVTSGWIGYVHHIGEHSSSVKIFRILRVLRTLKSVKRIKSMPKILTCLISSIKALSTVFLLCIVVFSCFAQLGVFYFKGNLRYRCASPSRNFCNPNASGQQCAGGAACIDSGQNPNHGLTALITFGVSLLTVFQCATLEGWVDTMNWTAETSGDASRIFFVLIVFIGSFFPFQSIHWDNYVSFTRLTRRNLKHPRILLKILQSTHRGLQSTSQCTHAPRCASCF